MQSLPGEVICEFYSKLWASTWFSFRFKCKYSLKIHMEVHGERKFECHYCNMKFKQKLVLKNHILTHTGERAHQCKFQISHSPPSFMFTRNSFLGEFCDKSFARPYDKKVHVRALHTGEFLTKHTCSECNEGFPSWSALYKHSISRHKIDIRSEKAKKYKLLESGTQANISSEQA